MLTVEPRNLEIESTILPTNHAPFVINSATQPDNIKDHYHFGSKLTISETIFFFEPIPVPKVEISGVESTSWRKEIEDDEESAFSKHKHKNKDLPDAPDFTDIDLSTMQMLGDKATTHRHSAEDVDIDLNILTLSVTITANILLYTQPIFSKED